jgi:hypothetical protein
MTLLQALDPLAIKMWPSNPDAAWQSDCILLFSYPRIPSNTVYKTLHNPEILCVQSSISLSSVLVFSLHCDPHNSSTLNLRVSWRVFLGSSVPGAGLQSLQPHLRNLQNLRVFDPPYRRSSNSCSFSCSPCPQYPSAPRAPNTGSVSPCFSVRPILVVFPVLPILVV